MTWTLAIDTSFHVAVGLAHDGVPVAFTVVPDTRAHAEALVPAVQELCARHVVLTDVDEFVVGMGPGPFTGLRVGVAAAWTLAELAGRQPHGVCSLDVLALQWGVTAPAEFVVASDARRSELYWARYVAGRRIGEPRVTAPGELPELPVGGPVPDKFRPDLDWDSEGPTVLDPSVMAARWGELPPAGDEPYYLRPADATVGGPPKSTLPRLRVRR
ncbi:tRNA (adenosine(37)-N6)-threonylcarbamoyltransferase complex dimerization subunit type 1 TsaB [Tessaracoccus rhinocerotis]|uniref:tRNA (Adenosine(37)-N6)-threonylcarbamoyltransferase complex dimerization subunit type 1 TsaB n=1 Tax=Tessaracoccus rhinocerotis TaxID=1689449 RepID=A0A553K588_9ACTN|nr:tRNA (adenosine(37)-N6)-threonylcarbamoyltransferase complex dimerization subunit type 1 TsaB [Tessaracoccus rhinocerotis]TRY19851.1 tRNA (adenosine(37)-N6)-threonylcarbamoyltransferase complex dimerization subunit type 1 TsaB [Tessaracoccus rhinocerotis]